MELTNDFRVSVPVSEAWKVLTDVERIAPMLPGAQLEQVEGDEYHGVVKVKVGPITAQYKGTATFIERDEAAGRVVLRASGRDTRGQGNASATITATLVPDGDVTNVTVLTDLTITGKVAQFGRGVLADVSGKLVGQFVAALEADLRSGDEATPAPTDTDVSDNAGAETSLDAPVTDSPTPSQSPQGAAENNGAGPRVIDAPEVEPIDLLDVAGGSVVKRLLPVAAAAAVIAVAVALRRRRARRRRQARASVTAVRQVQDHLRDRLSDVNLDHLRERLSDVNLDQLRERLSDVNLDQLRERLSDVNFDQLRDRLSDVNVDQLRDHLPEVNLDHLRGRLADVHLGDVQKLGRRTK
jgi:carbon monoxide dehydrogenase subunit G